MNFSLESETYKDSVKVEVTQQVFDCCGEHHNVSVICTLPFEKHNLVVTGLSHYNSKITITFCNIETGKNKHMDNCTFNTNCLMKWTEDSFLSCGNKNIHLHTLHPRIESSKIIFSETDELDMKYEDMDFLWMCRVSTTHIVALNKVLKGDSHVLWMNFEKKLIEKVINVGYTYYETRLLPSKNYPDCFYIFEMKVDLYNYKTGVLEKTFTPPVAGSGRGRKNVPELFALCVYHDKMGNEMICCGGKPRGRIYFFNTETEECFKTISPRVEDRDIYSACVYRDRFLFTGAWGDKGVLHIFDISTFEHISSKNVHKKTVKDVRIVKSLDSVGEIVLSSASRDHTARYTTLKSTHFVVVEDSDLNERVSFLWEENVDEICCFRDEESAGKFIVSLDLGTFKTKVFKCLLLM